MQLQEAIDTAVAEVGRCYWVKQPQIAWRCVASLPAATCSLRTCRAWAKPPLSHALADVLGLSWNRVQFTSDLLPADILGVSVFDRNDASFSFHPGPIFTQLLLADEINRTTPRTQSALLEAMAEGQVTVEGETRRLPDPFFVIATQNPVHQSGTYPLPESQLDRFLMRLELGYPHPQAEREMFERQHSDRHRSQPPAAVHRRGTAGADASRGSAGACLRQSPGLSATAGRLHPQSVRNLRLACRPAVAWRCWTARAPGQ